MHHKTCCSLYRILEAKEKGASVVHVDVDGIYLQKKRARLVEKDNTVPPLPIPTETPPLGWTEITAENYPKSSSALPNILPGELYRHMTLGVGYEGSSGRFRALIWGYTFWASGRVQSVAINVQNPCMCFVCGRVVLSMKDEVYVVDLVSHQTAKVERAQCKCVAAVNIICCVTCSSFPFIAFRQVVSMFHQYFTTSLD